MTGLGLACIGVAIYFGLSEIAQAIRHRNIEVNVKLPPIKVTSDDGASDIHGGSS